MENWNQELLSLRRTLHAQPETGATLPRTTAIVKEALIRYGYKPQEIAGGIVAILQGKKQGKTLLLRADMDGLPIKEKTDLPFAATNNCMHACGHDMHTTILLGAAKLLKEQEDSLCGTVKLLFQPDEEGFGGAKAMVEAGVLENPKVDGAMALHIASGVPTGKVLCCKGTSMAGCVLFRIRVWGLGCHGAMPNTGVDPIQIGAHIFLSLQGLIAREVAPTDPVSLTIGHITAGDAPNVIPQTLVMEGSIRGTDEKLINHLCRRVEEIARKTAAAFRGQAKIEEIASVPPMKNDPAMTEEMLSYMESFYGKEKVSVLPFGGMGSEDFAVFSKILPCCYFLLGAGTKEENPAFGAPMHNEKVVFNEDILPIGSSLLAHCAQKWLQKSSAP